MTIMFRTPTADDATALVALGRRSFIDAFGHLYSPENLMMFLDVVHNETAVAADLANPLRLYRVAETDGMMVAYCKLGLVSEFDFDLGERRGMDLKQLYVAGGQTGSGIGAAMMTWALETAYAHGFDDVILSVWSGNVAAQRFYARHGFEKWGDTIFMVGNHRDDEFLFGRRLTP